MILGAHNARQPDASPTAEMSTRQIHEAGATLQPAQSASRAFSSGHSTTIESMAHTGNLRHTVTMSTEDARQTHGKLHKEFCLVPSRYEGAIRRRRWRSNIRTLARSFRGAGLSWTPGRTQKARPSIAAVGQLGLLIAHQRSKRGHRPSMFTDEREWEALFQEVWYLEQEEEPLNRFVGSILVRWLTRSDEERNGWSCRVPLGDGRRCTQTIGRLDRAIIHVRDHVGLKPYP